MDVQVPLYRNHDKLNSISLNGQEKQFAFANTWEIEVFKEKNLFWSIILAFLKPNEKLKLEKFNILVQCLTGQTNTDKNYWTSIKKYNPFLNRYSCFYDPILISLIKLFEENVKKYIKDDTQRKYSSEHEKTILKATSLMLSCKIAVICEIHSQNHAAELTNPKLLFYPEGLVSEYRNWHREIILYWKIKDKNSPIKVAYKAFSFGLSEDIAYILQKTSFEKIIRQNNLRISEKELQKMYNLKGIRDNFLITMLKSDKPKYRKFIYFLYQQPSYILWKLSEAGFVTDPAYKDLTEKNHPNAFYYAVHFDQIQTLYLLYKYATSFARWPMGLSRTPAPEILSNLGQISSSLIDTKDLLKKSPQSSKVTDRLIYMEELFDIHNFHLTVRQKMLDVKGVNNLCQNKETKDTLIAILDVYINRFHSLSSVTKEKHLTIQGYEHYVKYINYFQNLDSVAALFFFDHISLLKDKSRLDLQPYENIESAFIYLVFMNKNCFSYIKTSSKYHMQLFGVVNKYFNMPYVITKFRNFKCKDLVMPLCYLSRMLFERKLIEFRNYLCSISATDENPSNSKPEPAGCNLKSVPIIKDELILFRLNSYLDLAIKVNLAGDNGTGIFIIQRTLEVLGECVWPNVEDTPTVAKSLLISSFTEILAKDLIKIRNILLHDRLKASHSRLAIEKDKSFFQHLQTELKLLKKALNHLFKLQTLRTKIYLCENKTNMIDYWQETVKETNTLKDNVSAENCKEDFFALVKASLKSQNIKKELAEIRRKMKKSTGMYVNHFQNHLDWIEKHKNGNETTKEKIEYRLICIQILLNFMVEEMIVKDELKAKFLLSIENARIKIEGADLCSQKIDSNFSVIVMDILEEYKTLKREIFKAPKLRIYESHRKVMNPIEDIEKSAIHKFCLILKGFHFISNTEKEDICSEVPQTFINNHNILKKLQNVFQTSNYDLNYLILELKKLQLSMTKISEAEEIVENKNLIQFQKFIDTNDHFGRLLKCLDESSINANEKKSLCDKFSFSENVELLLDDITKGNSKQMKDRTLDLLCDRSLRLKTLLVEHDSKICNLWEKAYSKREKQFNHEQILRFFMQNPELQTAVELLLCDSMVLLKDNNSKLNRFWKKSNSLFSGISLRNMLAHGNPLFEAVVKFFDPCDLPNEIIGKVLELVDDIGAIEAMCELRIKTGHDFGEFVKLVSSNCEEHSELIAKINTCNKWQNYAYLIPRHKNKQQNKNAVS